MGFSIIQSHKIILSGQKKFLVGKDFIWGGASYLKGCFSPLVLSSALDLVLGIFQIK